MLRISQMIDPWMPVVDLEKTLGHHRRKILKGDPILKIRMVQMG